jgi:hypothetical protein
MENITKEEKEFLKALIEFIKECNEKEVNETDI